MIQKNVKSHPPAGEAGNSNVKIATQNSKIENLKNSLCKSKTKIISAWIYPGVSPKGKDIYVPEDVWEEIEN